MTYVTCRLTAKNRDQLRNHTLGNPVWATFTFLRYSAFRRKPSPTCRTAFPAQHLRPSGVLSCWPDGLKLTHGFYLRSNEQHRSLVLLGVYLKYTCSRVTSASSALGVLNNYALYKSTRSLTHTSHIGYRACFHPYVT